MSDALITAQDVAKLLAIRPATVYLMCRRKELPHIRVTQGSRRALIRFKPRDIEKLIDERTVAGKG